uniref:Uncharacterized protein n=1 Tax=Rhizophora mucronata TaxID=61149 RepID=A0A2P2NF53_RHIMU
MKTLLVKTIFILHIVIYEL